MDGEVDRTFGEPPQLLTSPLLARRRLSAFGIRLDPVNENRREERREEGGETWRGPMLSLLRGEAQLLREKRRLDSVPCNELLGYELSPDSSPLES